ncbi:hypothetical protein [Nocardia cyriacigeorgica]|uniref:Uncharacterized protein n=2 Tax=Nocardia cyriacigeorgica TaxID=135487 RepID=A0A6P1D563_9NOCA|nr:hypothetical protein [Nocardia cyriacigeorgica]NEW45755.1 hypothetical protein [Nocardia cyriacigeorgica]
MSYPPPGPGSAPPYVQQPPMSAPRPPGGPGLPPPHQAPWPPQPPYQQTPPPGGGAGRKVLGGILGFVGVLALVGGGVLAENAYSNHQQLLPNAAYGENLWRDEPVDKVFPETLGGRTGYGGGLYDPEQAIWNRVGISADTECDKGLTRHTLEAAQTNGCKAVLRATYVDTTANMVATVALIVLPMGPEESGPKNKVADVYLDNRLIEGAVAPYAVPDTLAAGWKDRNGSYLHAMYGNEFPYAIGASIGSVDGYVAGELPEEWGELGGQDTDRDAWHANAQDLVDLFSGHLVELKNGDLR